MNALFLELPRAIVVVDQGPLDIGIGIWMRR